MKLLTYRADNQLKLGLLKRKWVIDLAIAYQFVTKLRRKESKNNFPIDMVSLLKNGLDKAKMVEEAVEDDLLGLQEKIPKAVLNIKYVKLLAPIPHPRKNIVCLGLNYSDHVEECKLPLPQHPIFFTKSSSAVIASNEPILLPKCSTEIDYEVELAIIFGKRGKNILKKEAFDYIAGYTVLNDITARDLQKNHFQWFKGKSLDTFAPLGPYLVTKEEISDPHNLKLSLKINGRIMQKSNTRNIYFKIPLLVEILTKDMTVEPGDIVATGTPSGVGFKRNPPIFLKCGDFVEAFVEKIGTLKNFVV